MLKPRINTDESLAGVLFAELCKHKYETAVEIMHDKYLDSKGLPAPRTRRYITSGE